MTSFIATWSGSRNLPPPAGFDVTNRLSAADREDFLGADLRRALYQGQTVSRSGVFRRGCAIYRKDIVPNRRAFDELESASRQFVSKDRAGFLARQAIRGIDVFSSALGLRRRLIDADRREVLLDRRRAFRP
jgi:hypothetical protein